MQELFNKAAAVELGQDAVLAKQAAEVIEIVGSAEAPSLGLGAAQWVVLNMYPS